MTRQVAEADWKHLRKLLPVVLDRYCAQILNEIARISANEAKSYHQRYLDIYRIIQSRDKAIAAMFNDPRRSNASMKISSIYSYGLFTEDEMQGFSQEVRSFAEFLMDG